MINAEDLEKIHRENLENDIVEYLAQSKEISLRQAMDIYYKSKLSEQIAEGSYGIQYLDGKHLAMDLIENEPELF